MNNGLYSLGLVLFGFFLADLCYMTYIISKDFNAVRLINLVSSRSSWITTIVGFVLASGLIYLSKVI